MERRRAPRRVPESGEPLARVRLRTGRELWVVNVSSTGALVEGTPRLLPGTHVEVHVVTPGGRVLVRSRIVRAYVCDVQPEVICYRGALVFDRPVDTSAGGYGIPNRLPGAGALSGSEYPSGVVPGAGVVVQGLASQGGSAPPRAYGIGLGNHRDTTVTSAEASRR